MRFSRSLPFAFLLLSSSIWAQQTPAPATQDPQAVVQAAIKALGGATAIGQPESWTFQAQMQGPRANGSVSYTMSTHTDTGHFVLPDGTARPAPMIHSHFVPALVGLILLKESQDPDFSLQYGGQSTLDSKPVTVVVIVFSAGPIQFPSQIWYFDSTNLPVQVDFRLPAEIGARQSPYGIVAFSDYRSVSGVLYPFRMVAFAPGNGNPPQITTLQSVTLNATASPNEFNGPAGDLR
jgi:hypothetical protein